MSINVVLQQMIIIFLLVMVGYLVAKAGIFSSVSSREFSVLVVNVCNPALIFSNVWSTDEVISSSRFFYTLLVSAGIYLVLIAVGFLLPRLLRLPKANRNSYALMSIFGNTGFIGIPVITAVVGPSGIIYIVIFNLLFVLLVYTLGKRLATSGVEKQANRIRLRDFVNVGSVCSILAIIIYLTRWTAPVVIVESVDYLGRATTALSMLVIGINLAQVSLKETFGDWKLYPFLILRQIVLPILLGFVLKPLIPDALMYSVLILLIAMPAANMPLMLADEAGADSRVLSRGIVVGTLLSVLTIPIVVWAVA